jgi:hypothetical protein
MRSSLFPRNRGVIVMRVIKQAILASSLLTFLAAAGFAFDDQNGQKKTPPKGKPPVVTPQPKGPPKDLPPEGKKPKRPDNFAF